MILNSLLALCWVKKHFLYNLPSFIFCGWLIKHFSLSPFSKSGIILYAFTKPYYLLISPPPLRSSLIIFGYPLIFPPLQYYFWKRESRILQGRPILAPLWNFIAMYSNTGSFVFIFLPNDPYYGVRLFHSRHILRHTVSWNSMISFVYFSSAYNIDSRVFSNPSFRRIFFIRIYQRLNLRPSTCKNMRCIIKVWFFLAFSTYLNT